MSLPLGSNWAANSAFDVFAYVPSGSTTPALCTIPWSSLSARATALGYYRGFLTNSASATCRTSNSATITLAANQGTYLGSFWTDASTAGEIDWNLGGSASGGTAGVLGLWNYYNRVPIVAASTDSGSSYTYGSATIREARGSAGNQISFIIGVVDLAFGFSYSAAVGAGNCLTGVGLNTTTAFSRQLQGIFGTSATSVEIAAGGGAALVPGIGLNFLAATENSPGAAGCTLDNIGSNTLSAWPMM